jgi:hypothetical protein
MNRAIEAPLLEAYRRDDLRALAQGIEVDAKEVRIMVSKSVLLHTLVTVSSAKTAGFGVPSFVPKWRARSASHASLARGFCKEIKGLASSSPDLLVQVLDVCWTFFCDRAEIRTRSATGTTR